LNAHFSSRWFSPKEGSTPGIISALFETSLRDRLACDERRNIPSTVRQGGTENVMARGKQKQGNGRRTAAEL